MPEPDLIVIASKGLDIDAVKAAESLAAHLLARSRLRTVPPQWRFAFEFGKALRQLSVECVEYLQQHGRPVVEPNSRDKALAVVRIVDAAPASAADEGTPPAAAGLPHELHAAVSSGGAWEIWPERLLEETLLSPLVPDREALHEALAGEIWVPAPRKFASPFLVAAEAVKAMTTGLMQAEPVARASSRDSRYSESREFLIDLQKPLIASMHWKDVDHQAIAQHVVRALHDVDELLRRFAIQSARAVLAGMFAVIRDARLRYPVEGHDSEARWAFDRWEWIALWGFGENRKRHECRIPLLADATTKDVALYLALTGQVESAIPLRIARAVLDAAFDFGQVPMRELRNLGKPTSGIPALPDGPIALPDIFRVAYPEDPVAGHGAGRDLTVRVGAAEQRTSVGWRPLDAAVRSWLGRRTEPNGRPSTNGAARGGPLVRDGSRLVWLSFDEPPADLRGAYPGLVVLADLAPKVVDCLERWRGKDAILTDSAARAADWLAAVPTSDPLVPRLAESIFAAVAPWPEPYHFRGSADAARGWTRSQCFERVRTYFERIAAAPLDREPPNLIATFLYLIEDKRLICHAWPGQLVEEWHFKVRTQDHTWIAGSLLVAPSDKDGQGASQANGPLRFARSSGGYILQCGSLCCALQERDRSLGS